MTLLRLTRQAEQDLLDAWRHVAKENPAAADNLVDAIYASAQQLAASPLIGRARAELGEGLRSWPTGTPYLIFYYPEESGITVIRVLHHARDVGALLP
ncbi:MAG: type II toxin-antitoxin system RelE/ParE family toxin [Pseudomonadota bacterium]